MPPGMNTPLFYHIEFVSSLQKVLQKVHEDKLCFCSIEFAIGAQTIELGVRHATQNTVLLFEIDLYLIGEETVLKNKDSQISAKGQSRISHIFYQHFRKDLVPKSV